MVAVGPFAFRDSSIPQEKEITVTGAPHFVCPECQGELVYNATERGYFWTCPRCNGRVIGLAVLRKEAGDEFAQRVVLEARRAQGGLGRPCPMCSNYLVRITMGAGAEAYDLEICRACQSVWVSQAAYSRLPLAAPPAPPPTAAVATPAAASPLPARPIPASQAGPPASPSVSLPPSNPPPGPAAGYPSGRSDRIVLTEEQQERIAPVYAQTAANEMSSRYRTNPSEPEAMWQRMRR